MVIETHQVLNEKFGLKPAKLHEGWTSSRAFIGGNSFREKFFFVFLLKLILVRYKKDM